MSKLKGIWTGYILTQEVNVGPILDFLDHKFVVTQIMQ